jgi:Tol biopolymer transport system component
LSHFVRVASRRVGVVASSLALIAAVLAGPAWAAFPGHNGRIATTTSKRYGLFIISTFPDGTGRHRLTGDEHYNSQPRYSPDGKHIVYKRDYELWLMDSQGRHHRVLAPRDGRTLGGRDAWWAPSGDRIVFDGLRDGSDALYIKRLGHPGFRLITHHDLGDPFNPVWSPLGDRIVFDTFLGDGVDDSIATHDLWSIRPDGSGLRSVIHTNADEYVSDWSPDGRWILFARKESPDYHMELWRSHPDGSHQQLLRDLGFDGDRAPAYSPNGRLIVFDCSTHVHRTCVMPADGSGTPRVIGRDWAVFGSEPSWQPRR